MFYMNMLSQILNVARLLKDGDKCSWPPSIVFSPSHLYMYLFVSNSLRPTPFSPSQISDHSSGGHLGSSFHRVRS
jgi:hypothetical protein